MSFYTPLRYPGGKGQLASWLATVIEHNDLTGGVYVEPYAGGCGAALQLLLTGKVGRIIINDADPAIYAFWWAVLNKSKELQERILHSEVTLAAREEQRAVLESPSQYSALDLAFAAFFVNRTSRSGILSGGVIGGKDQSGKYKIDARFNREDLASRIALIHSRRDDIDLHGVDALRLINSIRSKLRKRSLIYLDPPYYVKGAQLYRNYYSPSDHEAIASVIKQIQTPWLLTYDDCQPIKEIYKDCHGLTYSPYYSTHVSREHASEALFYGNMTLPSAPYLKRGSPSMPQKNVIHIRARQKVNPAALQR